MAVPTKATDNTAALTAWVATTLEQHASLTLTTAPVLTPLPGDAGARRYFQIQGYPQLLAVYAPVDSEDSHTFVAIANFLREQGIHAPQIYGTDFERGYLLIEHLGGALYLSKLDAINVEVLYGEAMIALLSMQQSPRSLETLPDYSPEKLLQEMDLFPHWFVRQLLGRDLNATEQLMLRDVFNLLIENAQGQPQCFVHRDYHSRNLIMREIGPPGVIDFQDGVWGPFTYDLVSLLRDCYVRWPEERVKNWLMAYMNMAMDVGVLTAGDFQQTGATLAQQVERWFDLMGLQRHIKVLGIFARLALRDNKSHYLYDLPLVMRYTLEVAERYPDLAAFAQWFKTELLPPIETHSWYRDYRSAGYSPGEPAAAVSPSWSQAISDKPVTNKTKPNQG